MQKESEKIEVSSCKQDGHTHAHTPHSVHKLGPAQGFRSGASYKHSTMVDIYMHASKEVQEKLTGSRKHFNIELETQPNCNKE